MNPTKSSTPSSTASSTTSSKLNVMTFKPLKKSGRTMTKQANQQFAKLIETSLGSGDLKAAVALPEGEDLNEWLASNTVDFYNQINMLYGVITQWCTPETCPVMSAGPMYEYHWADGVVHKTAVKVSAPVYVDCLMTWIQGHFDDKRIFPKEVGVPFSSSFQAVIKTILKRLFRVYAHIYHKHFENVKILKIEAHLTTSFRHFIYFVEEFHLIEPKELGPLAELIVALKQSD